MAIAFDSASSGEIASSTTLTVAHTCTGSDRVLFVAVFDAGFVSGVTYNGVALTLGKSQTIWYGGATAKIYYLINPSSGTNNIVLSRPTAGGMRLAAASYTGAGNSIDATTGNTNSGPGGVSSLTTIITTGVDNAWAIMCGISDNGGTLNGGTGATKRASPANGIVGIFDSNGAISPAGNHSMTYSGPNAHYVAALVSIGPSPASGPANLKPNLLTLGVG